MEIKGIKTDQESSPNQGNGIEETGPKLKRPIVVGKNPEVKIFKAGDLRTDHNRKEIASDGAL